MQRTLVQLRGKKVARRVIAQATKWVERDLRKGYIDRREYEARMRTIDEERRACGLA